ncbi:TetR/AcrR family transcriptional regulator [Pseudofrankia inefficax]|uniref:Regulatory protein TetR n=1 Tax=Pseudofrankia inefficax (strain DSM 45817 / CECT 9037 / DDB 130130 / EuI1c) TaxID=298654 RepID=E3J6E3_PSEI1|nr:TetR/AcrR family transcriptional regulator [Pseudofrankia inefficax]ADP79570.1 regulatory protein TetR [Pseudofrankia inefficax]
MTETNPDPEDGHAPAGRGRGRPRGLSERVRRDVFGAVRSMLATSGYEALRLDDVAEAAGVHKTTLYRQWPSKAALVRDVLVAAETAALPRPDEGSWERDLEKLREGLLVVFNHPTTIALIRTRATANDDVLTGGLQLASQEMAFLRLPFERAVARGEIDPDADVAMLVECLMSALTTRLCVTRLPIDEAFTHRLARLIKAAAGVGPAATEASGTERSAS